MRNMFPKGVFQPYPPLLQLVLLFVLAISMSSVFYIMGAGVVKILFGFDLFENMKIIKDFEKPGTVGAYKTLLLFQHLGMFIVPGFLFPFLLGKKTREFLMLGTIPDFPRKGFLTLFLMVALFPVSNFLAEMNAGLQFPESLDWLEKTLREWEDSAKGMTEALLGVDSVGGLLFNLFLVAIIPAIGEEIIFRGNLQRLLTRMTGNVHAGIWVAAIIFSSIHLQFFGFLPRLMLGGLFGYLLVWSGSIWIPIIAHFINNGIAVLVMFFINTDTFPEKVDEQGAREGQGWMIFFSILIVSGILWTFYQQASKNWKEEYTDGG